MRHARASRHALPILLSCLALAACSGDDRPTATEAAWSWCSEAGHEGESECLLGFAAGVSDARRGELTTQQVNAGAREQTGLVAPLAYVAGVRFVQSHGA